MLKQKIRTFLLRSAALKYRNYKSKVFYYHDVHSDHSFTAMSTPLELFKKHVDLLREQGYVIVDKITKKNKQAVITFDDGYRGLYEHFDYFIEQKIPVTLFLISSRIGQEKYLQTKEIVEMLKTGLLRIGSHTVSHQNLDELDDDVLIYELKESKAVLETWFGSTIDTLCYPRGRFNRKIVEEARRAGYKQQFSCLPGSAYDEVMEDVIRRNFVQHENDKNFLAWMQGGGKIFERRFRKMHIREKK